MDMFYLVAKFISFAIMISPFLILRKIMSKKHGHAFTKTGSVGLFWLSLLPTVFVWWLIQQVVKPDPSSLFVTYVIGLTSLTIGAYLVLRLAHLKAQKQK